MTTELEIWADNFKEGEFLLDRIAEVFPKSTKAYIHGFVPTLQINKPKKIKFVVYGYYSSWEKIPTKISDLIACGKPDGIIYDPKKDKIIFAYEETSANPNGNQASQRLERVWYAAYKKIPFVYYLSQYGLHKDKNLRETAIWPLYVAIKLSTQYAIPSLTLLYGNKKEPENYHIPKKSLKYFRELLKWYLHPYFSTTSNKQHPPILLNIFSDICNFVNSQLTNKKQTIPDEFAGSQILSSQNFHKYIVDRLHSRSNSTYSDKDFKWKLASQISQSTYKKYSPFNNFIIQIDKLHKNKQAWTPFKGTTIRSECEKKMKVEIEKQNKHKKILDKIKPINTSNLCLKDFPKHTKKKLKNGKTCQTRKITTTRSVIMLIDSTDDFLYCIEQIWKKHVRQKAEIILNTKLPVTFYVSSSLDSGGRAFKGDPFTGQITGYSKAFSFSITGKKERYMIAYYPNQLYSQFFTATGKKPDAKGVKCLEKNVDLIITRDGHLIDPKNWSLI